MRAAPVQFGPSPAQLARDQKCGGLLSQFDFEGDGDIGYDNDFDMCWGDDYAYASEHDGYVSGQGNFKCRSAHRTQNWQSWQGSTGHVGSSFDGDSGFGVKGRGKNAFLGQPQAQGQGQGCGAGQGQAHARLHQGRPAVRPQGGSPSSVLPRRRPWGVAGELWCRGRPRARLLSRLCSQCCVVASSGAQRRAGDAHRAQPGIRTVKVTCTLFESRPA